MYSLLQILLLILDIAFWVVMAHVILSWLINFQVLNLRQPLVAPARGSGHPRFAPPAADAG